MDKIQFNLALKMISACLIITLLVQNAIDMLLKMSPLHWWQIIWKFPPICLFYFTENIRCPLKFSFFFVSGNNCNKPLISNVSLKTVHLLSSPQYDVLHYANHILSVRIWCWQHVSVNKSSVAELSPVYCFYFFCLQQ